MADDSTEHIRYLELRLADCRQRARLHGHAIAVIEEQLGQARGGSAANKEFGPDEWFALARAEWLDRHHAAMSLQRALGDDRKLGALERFCEAGRAARHAEEFVARLGVCTAEAVPLMQAAEASARTVQPLLLSLLDWVTASSIPAQAQAQALLHGHWQTLLQNDPGCTWERICTHPPYRWRIPFADGPLGRLGQLLRDALGARMQALTTTELNQRDRAGMPLHDAAAMAALAAAQAAADAAAAETSWVLAPRTPADAARLYHQAYAALDRGNAIHAAQLGLYERLFELEAAAQSASGLMRMLLEERILCRLARAPHMAMAEAVLAHCQGLSQPHLEHHCRMLLAALTRSTSHIEVEHEVSVLGECLAVETTWNELVLRYALRPILAALAYENHPGPGPLIALQRSVWLARWLFGRDVLELWAVPRLQDFIDRMLVGYGLGQDQAGPAADPPPGALTGEVGLSLAREAQSLALAYAMAEVERRSSITPEELEALLEQPRFGTAEALVRHVAAIVHAAMQEAPRALCEPLDESQESAGELVQESAGELVLWGQPVRLSGLTEALSGPPRPQVEL